MTIITFCHRSAMRLSTLHILPALLLTSSAWAVQLPPLSGIWALRTALPEGSAVLGDAQPAAEVFISNTHVRGQFGCGRFQGDLTASDLKVRFSVRTLPPSPTERCVYAGDNPLVNALNSATRYAIGQRQLVVFSGKTRLVFERIGFVTPSRK
ncbi:hypothetical protein [Deinococcus humi]|uniref:Heat shock protein HslJ n=1 Tax=Deinococcus humi TaxID=662880 RepID=A0A7W8JTC6_9DEIO|nr:hypothetical protein [Deinococcus humi]MBB5362877.1 heat shock protein HslJ [Deinococcus humi]